MPGKFHRLLFLKVHRMRAPDYDRRRNQVRKLLRDASAEALLISSVFNVTYLTGFTGDDS